MTKDLLKKSKLSQHTYERGHSLCWKEATVLQIEPHTICEKHEESAHMSLVDQSTQLAHLSRLDSHYSRRSRKTASLSSVD
jgi:hypothetical protein